MRTRNLHRVFDSFSTAVHEQSLLRKLARRDLVHALGKPNVFLVGRHLDTGVKKAIGLVFHRGDHRLATVSHIQATDAAGKIQIAVAVHVFKPGIFRLRHIDRRANRQPARDGVGAALSQSFRLRSGNRSS